MFAAARYFASEHVLERAVFSPPWVSKLCPTAAAARLRKKRYARVIVQLCVSFNLKILQAGARLALARSPFVYPRASRLYLVSERINSAECIFQQSLRGFWKFASKRMALFSNTLISVISYWASIGQNLIFGTRVQEVSVSDAATMEEKWIFNLKPRKITGITRRNLTYTRKVDIIMAFSCPSDIFSHTIIELAFTAVFLNKSSRVLCKHARNCLGRLKSCSVTYEIDVKWLPTPADVCIAEINNLWIEWLMTSVKSWAELRAGVKTMNYCIDVSVPMIFHVPAICSKLKIDKSQ